MSTLANGDLAAAWVDDGAPSLFVVQRASGVFVALGLALAVWLVARRSTRMERPPSGGPYQRAGRATIQIAQDAREPPRSCIRRVGSPASMTASLRRPPGSRPLVFAHRGAAARAPENTLRAFARGLDEGADGVELDVRLAADDEVVVFHDPDLRRLARRPDVVAEMTSKQLRDVDVGGDRVPTLDEVLDLCTARGARVNVEVKGDVPDKRALAIAVARVLRRRPENEREAIFVSSFRPELLVALRVLGARVPMAFLFDAEHTGEARAAVLRRLSRPDGLHPHHPLCGPGAIARWRRRGLFVNAWTVDAPERARVLAEAGVDGLITNDPAGVLAALRAMR